MQLFLTKKSKADRASRGDDDRDEDEDSEDDDEDQASQNAQSRLEEIVRQMGEGLGE